MFLMIRKRLTYANVAMTLALVFAMTGGAYAASKYLITSTKQISPKVLKSLKGAKGVNGANGPAGAAGPAGPAGAAGAGTAGAAGPQGPAGAAGAKGETGTAGTNGTNGATGSPWTAGGTLPKGKTETGAWTFSTTSRIVTAAFPFPIPLAKPLGESEVHYVGPGVSAAACPGTATEPKAEPGNLCVYQSFVINVALNGTTETAGGEIFPTGAMPKELGGTRGAGTSGAALLVGSTGTEESLGWGTWAVTAEE